MKAFVITLTNNEYSLRKTKRCIETGRRIGKIDVEQFGAVDKIVARSVMEEHGLKWTWANNNISPSVCPISGLKQIPYYNANLDAKIGCSMSHYLLWQRCVDLDQPVLILEHDSVFIREFPQFEFDSICQINDPKGAGKNGRVMSEIMKKRGVVGVQPKTKNPAIRDPLIPDGLVGNSAYVVKPAAAQKLIHTFHTIGIWPNDATICIQLFPNLQEYFPFITKVEQDISTSSS